MSSKFLFSDFPRDRIEDCSTPDCPFLNVRVVWQLLLIQVSPTILQTATWKRSRRRHPRATMSLGGLKDIPTLSHQQASLDSSWSQQIVPLAPAAGLCHHKPLTFPFLVDTRFRLNTCDTSTEGSLSPLFATRAPNLFCRCSSAGADRAILLLLEATSLQACPDGICISFDPICGSIKQSPSAPLPSRWGAGTFLQHLCEDTHTSSFLFPCAM